MDADAGDKILREYLDERENVAKVFGNGAYLLNPSTMVCPIIKCKQARYVFNNPSQTKYFYSSRMSHLKKCHADDPIAERLIKRWEVMHGEGGGKLV